MDASEKQFRNFLSVDDFQPRSELVVAAHPVARAKFPVIDAHNHLTYPGFGFEDLDLEQSLRELDLVNVATVVNLSGESGDILKERIEKYDQAYSGRFLTYCNVDFSEVGTPGWTARTVRQLREDINNGARGFF